MLSVFLGFIAYKAICLSVGLLVKVSEIEGLLIALSVICLVGAYYIRPRRDCHNRLLRRFSNLVSAIGYIAIILLLGNWFLIPEIQTSNGNWLPIISVLIGLGAYICSRWRLYNRWVRRDPDTRERPAPPFGREWCRWIIVVLL